MTDTRLVLFLCTGNHYRSRFAECYFNSIASNLRIDFKAASRGLAVERGAANLGPMNDAAISKLVELGVKQPATHRAPMQLTMGDLRKSDCVVVLKAKEHLPLLTARFAFWAQKHLDCVQRWNIDDLEDLSPGFALPAIMRNVENLARSLSLM